jgi:hypothetical protein
MKFMGFDGEGALRHEVVLNYHIDEMGFRLGTQLSMSLQATDSWWCIVVVLYEGWLAGMRQWHVHRARQGFAFIVDDGTPRLRCK